MSFSDKVVGFIGTGVMGQSMARHLHGAGYIVNIHSRTKAKANHLMQEGCTWMSSVKDLSKSASIIISMLGFPEDVEKIYFGKDGILENANPNSILIDMTTSKPQLAKRIHVNAQTKNLNALDAPVSGGDIGAREARLSIMVGGDEKVFQSIIPVFKSLGRTIVYQGEAGSGQYAKCCNQILIASMMVGISEALTFLNSSGLDPERVLESIQSGAAASWSLSNLVPRILKDDYTPGFFVKHFVKDLNIALGAAEEMSLHLPGLALAKRCYEQLQAMGHGDLGTQAITKYYKAVVTSLQ